MTRYAQCHKRNCIRMCVAVSLLLGPHISDSSSSALELSDLVEQNKEASNKSDASADETYAAFADDQVYAFDKSDVWLFVDIDTGTIRSGYSERPHVRANREFRAIRIEPNGTWHVWLDKTGRLNARDSLFFSRDSRVYAISYIGEVFEFVRRGTYSSIDRVDAEKLELPIKGGDWSDNRGEDWSSNKKLVDEVNRVDAFNHIADTSYMRGGVDKDLFVKGGLTLSIEYVRNAQRDQMGYCKAIAQSLGRAKGHEWRVTVIDLLHPDSESD